MDLSSTSPQLPPNFPQEIMQEAGNAPEPWPKKLTIWDIRDTYNVSVPFTWLLPEAKDFAHDYHNLGYTVRVGGPAARLMPDYCGDYTCLEDHPGALAITNPLATRSTRGCNRGCSFCGVSRITGAFQELSDWKPWPVLVDDNFLMCSKAHFHSVIDALKPLRGVDFTQGLDARLLTKAQADRLLELDITARFAWDSPNCEEPVFRAIEIMRNGGLAKRRIGVYVLINFGESQAEALDRMEKLKVAGIRGYAMRYQPLDTLKKNEYVAPEWNQKELVRFARYWNRQSWFSKVPFDEFERAQ